MDDKDIDKIVDLGFAAIMIGIIGLMLYGMWRVVDGGGLYP